MNNRNREIDFELPDSLNRRLWSFEQHQRSHDAWDQLMHFNRVKAALAKREAEAKAAIAKAEREKAEAKKAERQQNRAKKQERKQNRQETINVVLSFLGRGIKTVHKIEAQIDERYTPYVRWALRTLIKRERVVKASAKTYKLAIE